MPKEIDLLSAVWEASPLLFAVTIFVLLIMLLSRLGMINFRVNDDHRYDRVDQRISDQDKRITATERDLAVLKSEMEWVKKK